MYVRGLTEVDTSRENSPLLTHLTCHSQLGTLSLRPSQVFPMGLFICLALVYNPYNKTKVVSLALF